MVAKISNLAFLEEVLYTMRDLWLTLQVQPTSKFPVTNWDEDATKTASELDTWLLQNGRERSQQEILLNMLRIGNTY